MNPEQTSEDFVWRLLIAMHGFVIWAAHFFGLYGLNTVATMLPSPSLVEPIAIGLTVFAAVALVALAAFCHAAKAASDTARFLKVVTLMSSALALVAVIWTAIPLVLLPVST